MPLVLLLAFGPRLAIAAPDGAPPAAPDAPAAVSPGAPAPSQADEAAAASLLSEAKARARDGAFPSALRLARQVVDRYPTTAAGLAGVRVVAQLVLIGQPAPPLVVADWYQGAGELPAQGAVLLVFFETWCPHCVEEGPHIAKVSTDWAGRGLSVVGLTRVTRSATDDAVRALIAADGWTFPVGREQDGSMSVAYGLTGLPFSVVVRDGIIVWSGHPALITDEVLKHALK